MLNNYKAEKSPSARRLFQFARYFEVEPDYLLGEAEDKSIKDIGSIFERLTTNQKQELYLLAHQWIINQIDKLWTSSSFSNTKAFRDLKLEVPNSKEVVYYMGIPIEVSFKKLAAPIHLILMNLTITCHLSSCLPTI